MSHDTKPRRHALVALIALTMSGTALSLGAAPASAAPADPDITGLVVNDANTGLPGVEVSAWTTPSDGSAPQYVGDTSTDGTGHYSLNNLDPASLAVNETDPAVTSETEFKLYFEWAPSTTADYHNTGYVDRGLGGTQTVRAAGSVVVPAGGTAVAPTQALTAAGGVLVKVVGPSGAPVNSGGYASLYVPDSAEPFNALVARASTSSDDYFYPDTDADSYPNAPVDGLVYIRAVEPGESYAVQAFGADYNDVTGTYTNYVGRFFGGDGSYSRAKPVAVKAGSFTEVTVQLTDKLTAIEEPRIVGNSSFGSKLKADPGTWLGGEGDSMVAREAGTDYAYQWLRGSKPVGTGPTYKLTKKDKGAKIRLVVTAYRQDFVGTATSDPTSKVGERSKASAKRLPGGDVAVTVKVAKKKLADKLGTPQGKVVLLTKDGEVASKKVELERGAAKLTPRKQFAGLKLVVLYLGGGKLGSDTAAVKG